MFNSSSIVALAGNYQIDDIQNIAPMQKSELKDKLILNIMKGVYNDMLSNEDLICVIETCGLYLNLQTIPDYATKNDLSYNGVKKHRNVRKIFNVRFVIDNK